MSEIKGLDELLKKLSKLENPSTKSLLAGALTLQKYSMENAPVKTGFLKASAESNEIEGGAELRFTANYSAYVELGTSKWAGKPFVRPAIDEHSTEIVKAVADKVEEDIQKRIE